MRLALVGDVDGSHLRPVVARLSVLALGAEQLEGIAFVALELGALPFHRDRFLVRHHVGDVDRERALHRLRFAGHKAGQQFA